MLYFAYGSNMSTPRLAARLPSAKVVDVAELAAHRLLFHKNGLDGSAKCDAFFTGSAEDAVFGAVFNIDPGEKPHLDDLEGLGCGYREKEVDLTGSSGQRMQAFTYCATLIDDALKPFDWYKQHVLYGAIEHGLPRAYIRRIEAVETIADPDARRQARETGIYR